MALKPLSTQTLRTGAAGTESSLALVANCERIALFNKSNQQIRWSLSSGIVDDNPLTLPYQFNTLDLSPVAHKVKLASGTFRYASNLEGAEFTITQYVKV